MLAQIILSYLNKIYNNDKDVFFILIVLKGKKNIEKTTTDTDVRVFYYFNLNQARTS